MRVGISAGVSAQRQAQADGPSQGLERLQAHALQQGWSIAVEDILMKATAARILNGRN
jgi:site-specific DNA recombinase